MTFWISWEWSSLFGSHSIFHPSTNYLLYQAAVLHHEHQLAETVNESEKEKEQRRDFCHNFLLGKHSRCRLTNCHIPLERRFGQQFPDSNKSCNAAVLLLRQYIGILIQKLLPKSYLKRDASVGVDQAANARFCHRSVSPDGKLVGREKSEWSKHGTYYSCPWEVRVLRPQPTRILELIMDEKISLRG